MEACSESGYCVSSMQLILAGEFLMGAVSGEGEDTDCAKLEASGVTCKDIWFGDESPQHDVYLDAFEIDAFEVTNAQFLDYLLSIGNKWGYDEDGVMIYASNLGKTNPLDGFPAIEFGDEGTPHLGQECTTTGKGYKIVSPDCSAYPTAANWHGAKRYCEWAGKRLCSEAEWERACMGPTHQLYSWGDEICEEQFAFANFTAAALKHDGECSIPGWPDGTNQLWPKNLCLAMNSAHFKGPVKVGSYPLGASPEGLHDMIGNAPEWVMDVADPDFYEASPYENPVQLEYTLQTSPEDGYEARVMRGRGYDSALKSTCTHRYLNQDSPISGSFQSSWGVVKGLAGIRCCKDGP